MLLFDLKNAYDFSSDYWPHISITGEKWQTRLLYLESVSHEEYAYAGWHHASHDTVEMEQLNDGR